MATGLTVVSRLCDSGTIRKKADRQSARAGEIDIYEQVNGVTNRANQATLHTGPGCTFSDPRGQTGSTLVSDCNVANGANGNTGCGVSMTGDANTFGTGLNNAGGGVFAMQHESSGVFVWHWSRDSAPAGTKRGDNSAIDVSSWGTPDAAFGFYQGTCSADHIDLNQQVRRAQTSLSISDRDGADVALSSGRHEHRFLWLVCFGV